MEAHCAAEPRGLPSLKNGVNIPVQPAALSPPPVLLLCSKLSQGSQRGLSRAKHWPGKREVTCSKSQARQQPRPPSFPIYHLFGTCCSSSTSPHVRHRVGRPVTSHLLGVLLLVIQSKRPSTLLTRRQGHLATSACHTHAPGAEPHPALKVSGSTH